MEKPKLFDHVIRNVMFSADQAASQAEKAHLVPVAQTRAAVRAAFRSAVVNGMITINDPKQWKEWMDVETKFDDE